MQYLNQQQAIKLDEDLMGKYRYSLSQLMEIAGLAVSQVILKEYPIQSKKQKVLILCGPGNNGGDGLVCGRYLKIFGYEVDIFYPKQSKNEHLQLLVEQLKMNNVTVHTEMPEIQHDLIIDAVFGFSFKGPMRGIFKDILEKLNDLTIPIVCVDIPSGWDVEKGYVNDGLKRCDVLVSLSVPKIGVKDFKGIHYLGGRFIPLEMQKELNLQLPYVGEELITKLN